MAEASREWEKSLEHLWNLLVVHKRTESQTCHDRNAQSELDAVEELHMENGSRPEAVDAEQENEVCRSHVEVNMFEAQQGGKYDSTGEEARLLPCEDERENQDSV